MPFLFLLLSPTFGMHQYTADLANRLEGAHLVTTARYPAECYAPHVQVSTPVATVDTGFSWRGLRPTPVKQILAAICKARPSLVHITGPHLWNVPVLRALKKEGIPTLHTLHDLAPHPGSPYGALLHLWNWQVMRWADHILVHSQAARATVLKAGLSSERVTYVPILHGFWSYQAPIEEALSYSISPSLLFFGRFERYKGLDVLLKAWVRAFPHLPKGAQLILAGRGNLTRYWRGPLPRGVIVRQGHIGDEEALALFQSCACLVLPYTGATQSALIAAAYYFRKPVIVSRSGALAEYVREGETGWVVSPGDTVSLGDTLVRALASPSRLRRMGEAARAWYDRARQEEWETLQGLYMRLGAK